MVDNQMIGGMAGIAILGLFVLMLLTGGGSHGAADPALCASVEREWDACIAENVDGQRDCGKIGEQAMSCRVALQGSGEPTDRYDML